MGNSRQQQELWTEDDIVQMLKNNNNPDPVLESGSTNSLCGYSPFYLGDMSQFTSRHILQASVSRNKVGRIEFSHDHVWPCNNLL